MSTPFAPPEIISDVSAGIYGEISKSVMLREPAINNFIKSAFLSIFYDNYYSIV